MHTKYNVKPEQAKVLNALEKQLGKIIPFVKISEYFTFGVLIEDKNITKLGLCGQGLLTLPKSIGSLFSLKELKLDHNTLTSLPESIGNLTSLEELSLRWNELEALPESITKLNSLTYLDIGSNKLTTIPESIVKLTSLKYLGLGGNELLTLPESIGSLTSLQILYLNNNHFRTLPESIAKLRSLTHFNLEHNNLWFLLESINNLKSLTYLNLGHNNLRTLPESIGNLTSLKILHLGHNNLRTLPESIGNLTSLQKLGVGNNMLKNLPESFWRLKSLTTLELSDNPWEGAWKGIEDYTIETILERSRQITPIIIFISHSKDDKKKYAVKDLKKDLKKQKEIHEVHSSGEDIIAESQLLLFLATKNSMTDEQCLHELGLAKNHNIGIVPIKGTDITFEELSKIDLGEDYHLKDKLGLAFDGKHFDIFCNELYEHIKKYKREVNVFEPDVSKSFEPEQKEIAKQWENVKSFFETLIESNELQANIEENLELYKKLCGEFRSKEITPVEYLIKWSQILNPKSN